MSKQVTVYNKQNDQSDLIQQIYKYSFAAQFNDLRLRDCSDILGVLKANYILKNIVEENFIVRKPYLFKITKGEKSILALGSIHSLSLDIYPLNLIKLMAGRKLLFVEKIGVENPYENVHQGITSTEASNESLTSACIKQNDEWFSDLPQKHQNYIVDVCGDMSQSATISLQKLLVLLKFYIGCEDGMDNQLFRGFLTMTGMIFPLEDIRLIDQQINQSSRNELLEILYNKIETDTRNGGCLVNHVYSKSNYILGNYFEHHPIPYTRSLEYWENIIVRNYGWVERMLKVFEGLFLVYGEDFSNSILMVGGIDHFRGKEGILGIMQDEHGFSVERVDLSGDFHPYDII